MTALFICIFSICGDHEPVHKTSTPLFFLDNTVLKEYWVTIYLQVATNLIMVVLPWLKLVTGHPQLDQPWLDQPVGIYGFTRNRAVFHI